METQNGIVNENVNSKGQRAGTTVKADFTSYI